MIHSEMLAVCPAMTTACRVDDIVTELLILLNTVSLECR